MSAPSVRQSLRCLAQWQHGARYSFRCSPKLSCLSRAQLNPIQLQRHQPSSRIVQSIRAFHNSPVALEASIPSQLPRQSRVRSGLYHFFAYSGAFIFITGGLVLAFFLYDASTYKEDSTAVDVPVNELALNPKRGGPKNLPIADWLISDEDNDDMRAQKDKPRLVILGSGWGSVAILKQLHPGDYHVTVVSPVNHFLFTPMLPSATVGTLELRSLVEPIRRIVSRIKGHFLNAEAVDVHFTEKLLEVSSTDEYGNKGNFYLPYDKLVVAVGEST